MRRVLVRYYGYVLEGSKKKYFIYSNDESKTGRIYIYVGGYIGMGDNGVRFGSGYSYVLGGVEKKDGWLYVVLFGSGKGGKYSIANIIESDKYKLTALLG